MRIHRRHLPNKVCTRGVNYEGHLYLPNKVCTRGVNYEGHVYLYNEMCI